VISEFGISISDLKEAKTTDYIIPKSKIRNKSNNDFGIRNFNFEFKDIQYNK